MDIQRLILMYVPDCNLSDDMELSCKQNQYIRYNQMLLVCICAFFIGLCVFIAGVVILNNASFITQTTQRSSAATDTISPLICIDSHIDCNGHGVCDENTGKCVCIFGYITYDSSDNIQCNYEQKRRLTAYVYATFLGNLGVGRFYTGYIFGGVCKLLLFIISCCWGGFTIKKFATTAVNSIMNDNSIMPYIKLMCLGSTTTVFIIWWFCDVILFATGSIDDINGVPLA
eukprot:244861_1